MFVHRDNSNYWSVEEERHHDCRYLGILFGGLTGMLSAFALIFYSDSQSKTGLFVSLWLSLTVLGSYLGDKAARLCWINGCKLGIPKDGTLLPLRKEKQPHDDTSAVSAQVTSAVQKELITPSYQS